MSLELVKAWFGKIAEAEKDLPLLIVEGKAYTPRATLSEVERGTDLGKKLQSLVEEMKLGSPQIEEEQLAKLRLITRLKPMPEKPLVATLGLPGRTYTPSQLREEIEKQTAIGRDWVRAEISHMKRLVEVR